MSPQRGVRWVALYAVVAASAGGAIPAGAQVSDLANRLLDVEQTILARSPRLLGMGGITFVLDDAHNRIQLWDLGANPAGVLAADSTSTFELGPSTATASGVRDLLDSTPVRERQHLAAREVRLFM